MRTSATVSETEQAHRLIEALLTHLAHGREWATPGVQAALQRVVTGLDAGVETASPRVQALLRRLAEDLAGGVETLTPRVQESLRRVVSQSQPVEALDLPAAEGVKSGSRTWLWLTGLLALSMAAAGVVAFRSSRPSPEAAPVAAEQDTVDVTPDSDPDLSSGNI